VLHQERHVLFNPKSYGGQPSMASGTLSRAATTTRRHVPSQPLVSVPATSVFEPGSLLDRQGWFSPLSFFGIFVFCVMWWEISNHSLFFIAVCVFTFFCGEVWWFRDFQSNRSFLPSLPFFLPCVYIKEKKVEIVSLFTSFWDIYIYIPTFFLR